MFMSAIGSIFLEPLIRPTVYRKHWATIGTGVAGIIAQVIGTDSGLTPEQIQGFTAVVTMLLVNLLSNDKV